MKLRQLNKNYFLLSIVSGLLLYLSWPPLPFTFLIFFGMIPLLFIEDNISNKSDHASSGQLFVYIYLGFLIWNGLATWWIKNATFGGAIGAIFANSLLMCIPFLLFHRTKRIFGPGTGYFSLILYWIGFEYLHHLWELTWPWMTLGNALSKHPSWIQWYEYTGTLGGTFWILLITITLFVAIKEFLSYRSENGGDSGGQFIVFGKPLAIILVPLLISIYMYHSYSESGKEVEVVVIQPNIDPYQKFNGLSPDEQLEKLMVLSKQQIDQNTQYLVWPETALHHELWIAKLQEAAPIQKIRAFIKEYPNLNLITGATPFEMLPPKHTSSTAREFSNGECCYDAFNSAIQISNHTDHIPVYHKSKLVVGVERMPYPFLFKFLEPFAINLGGVVGSLGTQKERGVFYSKDSIGVGPVICYESVFGEFVGGYIKNNAHLIFIITNDGWWGKTDGYKQHLSYASLRAIETRRSIARSANTGVSCFLDQKGNIRQATNYDEEAAIKSTILANDKVTFYSSHGDYLGRVAVFVSVLLIIYGLVKGKIARKLKK